MSPIFSGVTGPKFKKCLCNIDASFVLLTRPFRLWYPIPFRNGRAISAGGVGNFAPFFATKLVKIDWSSAIQYLSYGAKIVKIDPADPEIPWLRANKSSTKRNWLPWQCPLRYWKNNFRSVIYTQKAFIWCKNCKNRTCFAFCLRHKIGCHGNVPWGIRKNGPDKEYLPVAHSKKKKKRRN